MEKISDAPQEPPGERTHVPQVVEDLHFFASSDFIDPNQYDTKDLPGGFAVHNGIRINAQIIGESHVLNVFCEHRHVLSEVVACVPTCKGSNFFADYPITQKPKVFTYNGGIYRYRIKHSIGTLAQMQKSINKTMQLASNIHNQSAVGLVKAFPAAIHGQYEPKTIVAAAISPKGILRIGTVHEYLPQGKAVVTVSTIWLSKDLTKKGGST